LAQLCYSPQCRYCIRMRKSRTHCKIRFSSCFILLH
jgi:hypothetical protein